MECVNLKELTLPSGCYSHAVKAGGFCFLSGQLGLVSGKLVSDDFCTQLRQCFMNIKSVCKSVGKSLDDVVKLTVYYVDIADRTNIDVVSREFFKNSYPGRTRVVVSALSYDAKVEVDCIVSLVK